MKTNKIIPSPDEVKIIKAAQIRFSQTEFPSNEPSTIYKIGYLQGFMDSLQQKGNEGKSNG